MKEYTLEPSGSKFMDDLLGGRIARIGEKWFWTEWHVSYDQRPCSTAKNFVTREEAIENFNKQLGQLREAWGHNGAKFSETSNEREDGYKSVRFRSIRKNGKPGTLTGILYLNKINRKI